MAKPFSNIPPSQLLTAQEWQILDMIKRCPVTNGQLRNIVKSPKR